jgi:predicted small secreted protein
MKTESKTMGRVRFAFVVAASAAAIALSACNTVSGAGKDLQEGSDAVKDAITD